MKFWAREYPAPDYAIVLGELAGYTERNGGVGHRYRILIDFLASKDLSFKVLVFSDGKFPTSMDSHISLETWSSKIPWPLRLAYRAVYVRFWTKSLSPRVILSPDWEGLCAFTPSKLPLVTNLVTNLELIHEISKIKRKNTVLRNTGYRIQKWLERRQTKRSDSLIAISSAIKSWTEANFENLAEISVIPNFISAPGSKPRISAEASILPLTEASYLLFVGRLESRKGVVETFEAFGKLHMDFPNLNLYLAGSHGDQSAEPSKEDLLRILPPAANSRVRFLGNVSKSDLSILLGNATAVLTPSHWEGFGNATAEAMAAGAAVIATSGSGFSDFCVDKFNCLLAEPSNSQDLDRTIRLLLTNGALRAQIQRQAPAVADILSVSILGLKYLEVLEPFVGDAPKSEAVR